MKSKSARRSVRPDKTSRRPSQRLVGEHGWNSASRRSKPIRSMMSTTSTSASAANKRYEGARPVPREKLQNLDVWCGLSAAENGLQNDGGGSVRLLCVITYKYKVFMNLVRSVPANLPTK